LQGARRRAGGSVAAAIGSGNLVRPDDETSNAGVTIPQGADANIATSA